MSNDALYDEYKRITGCRILTRNPTEIPLDCPVEALRCCLIERNGMKRKRCMRYCLDIPLDDYLKHLVKEKKLPIEFEESSLNDDDGPSTSGEHKEEVSSHSRICLYHFRIIRFSKDGVISQSLLTKPRLNVAENFYIKDKIFPFTHEKRKSDIMKDEVGEQLADELGLDPPFDKLAKFMTIDVEALNPDMDAKEKEEILEEVNEEASNMLKTYYVEDSSDEEDDYEDGDDEEFNESIRTAGLDQLSAAALRRYRKHYRIPTKANASKSVMLEGVACHYLTTVATPGEVIGNFFQALRRDRERQRKT